MPDEYDTSRADNPDYAATGSQGNPFDVDADEDMQDVSGDPMGADVGDSDVEKEPELDLTIFDLDYATPYAGQVRMTRRAFQKAGLQDSRIDKRYEFVNRESGEYDEEDRKLWDIFDGQPLVKGSNAERLQVCASCNLYLLGLCFPGYLSAAQKELNSIYSVVR